MELPKITRAYLVVTNQCQLRCRYCWTHKDSGEMDTETALAAVKFVLQNAEDEGVTPHFDFFGGEPLLRWDEVIVPCVQYIRNIYQKPCELGITTNCLLLDEDKLRFLRDNSIAMLVSMDGAKETHDLNRRFPDGSGSFDAIASKIPLILSHYPEIEVRMTLTPETAGRFSTDVAFLLDSGFKGVDCVPDIFAEWSDEALKELRVQLRLLSDDYIAHFTEYGPGGGFREFMRGFRDVKRVNCAYASGEHRNLGCVRCGIGNSAQGAINRLGDIYPCHEAGCDEALRIGNIFTGMDEARRAALSGTYDPEKVHGLNCDTCRYDHVCNGGCSVFNYMLYHDFNKVPQMTCIWKQMMLDECEYTLGKMADAGDTSFRDYFRSL